MIHIKAVPITWLNTVAGKRYRLGSALIMLLALSHCAQLSQVDITPATPGTPVAVEPEQQAPPESSQPAGQTITADITTPVVQVQPRLAPELLARFQQAKQLMREEQYQAALTLLEPLAQQVPAATGIGYNLALCYWQLQQTERARQQLTSVLEQAPGFVDAVNLLGVLARQAGHFNQARRYWLDALALQSNYASAHKNLGFLYELYLAQPEQARYHYLQYQQLTGDPMAEAWLSLLEQQQE